MLSAVNANEQKQLDELSECLKKTKNCQVVATLRQFAEDRNGEIQSVDIQQAAADSVNTINVSGNLVYAELLEPEEPLNDDTVLNNLKKIKAMWQAVLNRSTVLFLQGKPCDYRITIDLICAELENNKVYCISFFNPTFMASEDHGISLAVPLENLMFGIEEMTLQEIEYEEEVMEAEGRLPYDDEGDDEDDGYGRRERRSGLSGSDILGDILRH